MEKSEELSRLFEEWAAMHEKEREEDYYYYHRKNPDDKGYVPKNNFIYDGFISEEKYINSDKKVLFIAKECNLGSDSCNFPVERYTDDSNFWAKKEIENEITGVSSSNRFLQGIAMLYNAIQNEDYSSPTKDICFLLGTSFMNLNKRGGYNYCVWRTLEEYVKKYKDEIKKQITIISPDIIVCCGDGVKYLVDTYNLSNGIKVCRSYHPNYRRKSDLDKLKYLESSITVEQ